MTNDSFRADEGAVPLANLSLYREFQAELAEILRHKWYLSEKAGYDVGFEQALVDWIVHHHQAWRQNRRTRPLAYPAASLGSTANAAC